jgi:hypothetical protein
MSKGLYKDGKVEGIWEYYYENGNLKRKELYKNGELVKKLPLDEMKINKPLNRTDDNGLKQGYWEYYDKSSGLLNSKGFYKDNKPDGKWEFYLFGNLSQKGSYKNNKKDGVWETYSGSGNLISRVLYKDGNISKRLSLDEMKINKPNVFIEEENTKIDPIILAFLKYWVDEEYWGKYTSFKDVYEFALENDYVDGDEISFENFSNQMKLYINRIIALRDADSMVYLVVKPGGVMGVSEESMDDILFLYSGHNDGDFDLLNKQMREKALKYLSKND